MVIQLDFVKNFPQSVDVIAGWYREQWGDVYPDRSLAYWKNRVYLSDDTVPMTLVAFDERQRVLGTVALLYEGFSGAPKDSVWLTTLFVDPVFRGQGIGSRLCDFSDTVAKRLGLHELYLYTYTTGEIYSKLGWCKVDTLQHKDKPTLLMKKSLL